MISYHFNNTESINRYLIEIEGLKLSWESVKVLPQIEEKILRQSILRSAVFSARIEGNPLMVSNIDRFDDKEIHKIEINNLLSAYHKLNINQPVSNLSIAYIKNLHQEVMRGISLMAGKFRQEPWAVYDGSGKVIHLAPFFGEVPRLMEEYIGYLKESEAHPVILAAIGQFILEKIHPFADGNGRVGRLISATILKQGGYDFKGLLAVEEYTDEHREAYYYALEPSADMTEFIEYFLNSMIVSGKKILPKLMQTPVSTPGLSARREEILETIADHPICSFDFLSRRFAGVNPKTLHYDLRQMLKMGLIVKMGATRGVVYKINE